MPPSTIVRRRLLIPNAIDVDGCDCGQLHQCCMQHMSHSALSAAGCGVGALDIHMPRLVGRCLDVKSHVDAQKFHEHICGHLRRSLSETWLSHECAALPRLWLVEQCHGHLPSSTRYPYHLAIPMPDPRSSIQLWPFPVGRSEVGFAVACQRAH